MITAALLRRIAPTKAKDEIIVPLADALTADFPKYEINTVFRAAHFLAQAAHESDGFHTLQEYASGAEYEGRDDLGNVNVGDGRLFKGRGIFQLTGRDNYVRMGKRLGLDLVNNPDWAAHADTSALVALIYWTDRGLNVYADNDDIRSITKKINGGYNGLDSRVAYLNLAKAALDEMA